MTEKKTPFEMAKDYYPKLWSEDRIKALYEKGKLTKGEYAEITGKSIDEVV